MSTRAAGALSALDRHLHWARTTHGDLALALIFWVLDTVVFATRLPDGALRPVIVVASLVGFLPLAWRRSAPRTVFTLLWVHHLGASLLIDGYRPFLGILVALYSLSRIDGRRSSLIALITTYLLIAPLAVAQEWDDNPGESRLRVAIFICLLEALFAGASWTLGRWAQRNLRHVSALEEQRDRAAVEAVLRERRRIARELHDIVSHSVSVMVVQAAGARRQLATNPARADAALAHIEGVGRQSMAELRRLLSVLDEPEDLDTERGRPIRGQPQPGIADIPQLIESVRLSGLAVELVESGISRRLDPSVELSAYRIVQESLTNSIKHAGTNATASVQLTWSTDSLGILISDNGGEDAQVDSHLSTLHGLPGLRERARAVGGQLEAGPAESGGFRVAAVLPLAGSGIEDPGPSTGGS